ncbi:thiolase-like protein, partial [Ochromonadaceae sp. CCMP2298]
MLSLHNWLEQRFSLSLPPAYLFTACTPRKIQEDFITRLSDTRPPPPPPPPPRSDPSPPPQDSQAVAIVGIACKLPGGIDSVDEFWRVLLRKECKASKVPFERWDVDSLDMAELVSDPDKRRSVQYGCFVDDAEAFDASFFGINKDETRNMDPNQRLLLEIITKALYDSGKTKQEIAGSNTGVWIGMSNSDYQDVPGAGFRESKSVYGATGGAASVAAGRVSYCLGLEGPSLVVDTACSSSLVALHQAATSLRLGECSAAVVAGVNLMLTPWISVAYARAGMTSADGKCHTFDEAANGYCRGEGCAAVVLKRVSDLQEGECVYAILRGSAVVQDGQSASLTAPNGGAQEKLLRAALADAKLLPQSVRYIEAHGTGTKLGDPIEVSAIASVYGDRSDHNPLFVSSSKANIGHLEAAAGMAGLIAAVLVVGHSTAPPNCHLTKLNTMIKKTLQGAPIHFPRTAMNLKGGVGEGLIAGVSSFGYSGTIAHALIEEPPAHSRRVLAPILPAEFSNPTVWQFSGQGTLAINVGRNLYFCSVAFRSAMDRCDAAAEPLLGIPISSILYPRAEVERQAVELLLDTCFAQPALVALEYCLAQEWISRGHWPSLVLGHSLGEYAAAVVAGVMSIESCLKLVCARAECVKNADFADGVMVALRATRAQVEGAIVAANATEEAAVAAVNKARSVVLSGSIEGVQRTLEVLGESAMICKLDVEYAFHSPLMLPVQSAYRSVLEATSLFAPQIPLISTVRGHEAVEGDVCGTQYWLDHLVDPVLYETAVQRALALGKMAFLEIGADSTLSRLTRSIDPGVAVASSAEYLC